MIEQELGIKPTLREGGIGQLDVLVDGQALATRKRGFWERMFGGAWPEPSDVIDALRAAGA